MTPITIDLPHRLGAVEARRRIETSAGSLGRYLPAGAAVQQHWTDDRLHMNIGVMGQEVRTVLHVREAVVRVELVLPPALAFFGDAIAAGIRKGGAQLLEDKTAKP